MHFLNVHRHDSPATRCYAACSSCKHSTRRKFSNLYSRGGRRGAKRSPSPLRAPLITLDASLSTPRTTTTVGLVYVRNTPLKRKTRVKIGVSFRSSQSGFVFLSRDFYFQQWTVDCWCETDEFRIWRWDCSFVQRIWWKVWWKVSV